MCAAGVGAERARRGRAGARPVRRVRGRARRAAAGRGRGGRRRRALPAHLRTGRQQTQVTTVLPFLRF